MNILEKELKIPNHIGFIMDGNGRWATKKMLPRVVGHRHGVTALKRVLNACIKYGISVVSLYAFSSENWKRPEKEREALFNMIKEFVEKDVPNKLAKPVVVKVMGDISALPSDVIEALEKVKENTKNNTAMIVNIGINYGGREEIVRAVNNALNNGCKILTEDDISRNLDTADFPELDLVVRTSGEIRLSNFMLWQSAYAEFIFLDKLWPDMTKKDVEEILKIYTGRTRRFGGIVQ